MHDSEYGGQCFFVENGGMITSEFRIAEDFNAPRGLFAPVVGMICPQLDAAGLIVPLRQIEGSLVNYFLPLS